MGMREAGSVSEVQRLAAAEIAKLREKMRWEWRLDANERLFGSAYGPWPTPLLGGIEEVLSRTAQEGAGSDPPRDSPPLRGGDCER